MKKLVLAICLIATNCLVFAIKPVATRFVIPEVPYEAIELKNGMLAFQSQEVFMRTIQALEDAERNEEVQRQLQEANRNEDENENIVTVFDLFEQSMGFENSLRLTIVQAESIREDSERSKQIHVGSPYLQTMLNAASEIKIGAYIYKLEDANAYFVILNDNLETLNYLRSLSDLSRFEYHDDLVYTDNRIEKGDTPFEEMVMAKCDFTVKLGVVDLQGFNATIIPESGALNPKFTWTLTNMLNNKIITSGTGTNVSVALAPFTALGPFGGPPQHSLISGVRFIVKMVAENCEKERKSELALNCGIHLADETAEAKYNEGKNKIVASVCMDNYVFYASVGAKSYNKVKKNNGGWKSAKINEMGLQFSENSFYFKGCQIQVNLPEDYKQSAKDCDEVRHEDPRDSDFLRKAPINIISCSFFVKPTKEKLLTITLDK